MIRRSSPLVLLLSAYLIIGGLFAFYTPRWQAPDEPAHYNYIRQVAKGKVPVIESEDYDQAYQVKVISSRFDPVYSVDGADGFEYEDHQPPLYYLLQAPVFRLFSGQLRPMRFFSVLIGALSLVVVYLVASSIFANREWMVLAATAFVAFLPQHVAMLAAVNNDSLAELIIALIMLLLIRLIISETKQGEDLEASSRGARRPAFYIALGLILGLGLLTKATVYVTIPLVAVVLMWIGRRDGSGIWRLLLWVFGPALLLGGIWWFRNILVYGGIDVLGLAAHNRVVVGQPRTAEWIAERGLDGAAAAFVRTTFQSFWGQFGWMGVVMPDWVYLSLAGFTVLTIGGLAWWWLDKARKIDKAGMWPGEMTRTGGQMVWTIMTGLFGLSLASYLAYNTTFIQHQGRYLFPALIPLSAGVTIAWAHIIRPILGRGSNAGYLLPTGLALALIGLDLLALFRFIVPALAL